MSAPKPIAKAAKPKRKRAPVVSKKKAPSMIEEAFAQNIVNGMAQSEAYVAATGKTHLAQNSAWQRGYEFSLRPIVQERIAELKAQIAEKQLWNREMSVKALITAYRTGNAAVKVSAVKELNAMHGFNAPIKHDVEVGAKPDRIIIVPGE